MHLFNHEMNNTIETDGYTRLSLKIISKGDVGRGLVVT